MSINVVRKTVAPFPPPLQLGALVRPPHGPTPRPPTLRRVGSASTYREKTEKRTLPPRSVSQISVKEDNIENQFDSDSDSEIDTYRKPNACGWCADTTRQLKNMRHLIARTQKVNADLTAESQRWRSHFESAAQQLARHAGGTQVVHLQEQLASKEQECNQAKSRLTDLERRFAAEQYQARITIDQLMENSNPQSLKDEITNLRANALQSAAEIERLRREVGIASQSIRELTDKKSVSQDDTRRLRSELADEKKLSSELRVSDAASKSREEALRKQLEHLEATLRAKPDTSAEVELLRKENAVLSATSDRVLQDKLSLQARLDALQDNGDKMNGKLREEMARHEQSMREQQLLWQQRQENLTQSITDLDSQLSLERRAHEHTQHRLMNADKQNLLLTREIGDSQSRILALEAQLTSALKEGSNGERDARDQIRLLQVELQKEEQQRIQFAGQVDHLKKHHGEMQTENARLMKDFSNLARKVDDYKLEVKILQQKLTEAENRPAPEPKTVEKVKVLVVVVREGTTPGKFDICMEESGLKGVSSAMQDRIRDAVAKKLKERAGTQNPITV